MAAQLHRFAQLAFVDLGSHNTNRFSAVIGPAFRIE
jgi:hypothetical protein